MIAAIYARKSTEQTGVADEQKSVARQVDHARQYAERKGWMVAEEHVYIDDGISGAEFANRPGFLRLMNALKPRPTFHMLVMSEESRLGREAIETAYALKQLVTAGVRVFFYLEDRERALDSPTDKIMLSLTAFADELEREKARQRTYDALLRKARAGHVTGGVVFGYENVEILGPGGKRSHVERRIVDEEAAVIRRIFELCAAGKGMRTIAGLLNEAGMLAPRPQQGRPKGWAPSTAREALYRDLYRGVIVWNRTRKRNTWGLEQRSHRASTDWITLPAPELQIVPDALWQAAHARLDRTRQTYLRGTDGQLWGRPSKCLESRYLLAGIARCGACGASLLVRSRGHGPKNAKRRAFYYACSAMHRKGKSICANTLEMPLTDADNAVLDALEEDLLDASILEEAAARAVARLTTPTEDPSVRRKALEKALGEVALELERLTEALAQGAAVTSVVGAIRERERRCEALRDELAALDRPRPVPLDARRLTEALLAKARDWRALLRKHAPIARQMILKLIDGRIVFTPDASARRYTFCATGTLSRFFNGIVDPLVLASPSGNAQQWTRPVVPRHVKAA